MTGFEEEDYDLFDEPECEPNPALVEAAERYREAIRSGELISKGTNLDMIRTYIVEVWHFDPRPDVGFWQQRVVLQSKRDMSNEVLRDLCIDQEKVEARTGSDLFLDWLLISEELSRNALESVGDGAWRVPISFNFDTDTVVKYMTINQVTAHLVD